MELFWFAVAAACSLTILTAVTLIAVGVTRLVAPSAFRQSRQKGRR